MKPFCYIVVLGFALFIALSTSFSCRKSASAPPKIDTLALISGIAGVYNWKGKTLKSGGMSAPPYPVVSRDTFESEIEVYSDTEIHMSITVTGNNILKLRVLDIHDSVAVFTSSSDIYTSYPYSVDTITYYFGKKTLRYGAYEQYKYLSIRYEYYSPEIPNTGEACLSKMADEHCVWSGLTYIVSWDSFGQIRYTDTTSVSHSFQLLIFNESKISSGEWYDHPEASMRVDTMALLWSNDSLSAFMGLMHVKKVRIKDSMVINCGRKTMYWHQWFIDTVSGGGSERILHYP